MKPTFLILAATFLGSVSHAQITNNLAAYWDFEGTGNNNAVATGGAAFNGTLTNGATTSGAAIKVGTGSLNLDGVNDYFTVGSSVNVSAAWTVSAWFRSDISPAGAVREMVYENIGSYAMSFGLRDGTAGNTNYQIFNQRTQGDLSQDLQIADAQTAAIWHNIVTAFIPATASTAGSITGYLDGVARYSIVVPIGSTHTAATGFRIGTYRNADGRYFDGAIDEVAMWTSAASLGEAYSIYNHGDKGFALSTVARVKGDNLTDLNTGTSWTTNSAPTVGETMLFDSTYTQSGGLNTGGTISLAGLRVSTGTGLININNTGGALDLGALGVDMAGATRDLTVENLTISASQRWNIGAGATFTTGATTNLSGAASITKIGSGTAVLSSANSFTGATNVDAGTMKLANSLALQNSTLNVGAGSVVFDSSVGSNSFTVGGLGGSGNLALQNNAGSPAPVALTAGGNNTDSTYSGILSGSGSLTKTGTSILTLSGANTFAGGLAINQGRIITATPGSLSTGTITVGQNANYGTAYASGGAPFLAITSAGASEITNNIVLPAPGNLRYYAIQKGTVGSNLTLSGNISGGGSNMVLQLDSATGGDSTTNFTLSGTNSFNGQLRLNRGFLTLTNSAAAGNATIFLQTNPNTSGNLRFSNSFTLANNIQFGTTADNTISTGTNNVTLAGTLTSTVGWSKVNGSGTLTLTGNNNISGVTTISAGTLQIGDGGTTGIIGGTAGITNNGTIAFNRSDSISFANVISGTGNLTKVGGGNLTLTGNNTFTGGTSINAGTLLLGDGGTSGALAGTGTITNDSILNFNRSDTIVQGSAFGNLITGTGKLVQSGTGTTVLNSVNDFTGITEISNGTLEVFGSDALKSTSHLVTTGGTLLLSGSGNRINDIAQITLSGGTINTNGLSEDFGLLNLTGTSVITLGAGSSVISFADSNTSNWTGQLSIWNWSGSLTGGGTDQIHFSSLSGLTPAQLAKISFVDPEGLPSGTYGAQLVGSGELVPIPEPSNIITGIFLLSVVGFSRRKRH